LGRSSRGSPSRRAPGSDASPKRLGKDGWVPACRARAWNPKGSERSAPSEVCRHPPVRTDKAGSRERADPVKLTPMSIFEIVILGVVLVGFVGLIAYVARHARSGDE